MVFASRRKVIFVHGCYWHRHDCPLGRPTALTNAEFWKRKIEGNVVRDERNNDALRKLGWNVHIVWECELRDTQSLEKRLVAYLGYEGLA
jgi:DNA mismatch endonuclease (patch repair protein)